jgi:cytoskeletal protein CcmA (bactofilin family)
MIWKKSEAEEASPQAQSQPQAPVAPSPRNQPAAAKERALIGPSIEIKGSLSGGEDLHIEGRIDGKIELQQQSVTIGKSGRVNADVVGRIIVVMGEVNGDIYGEEQIVLRPSSAVHGNLFAPRVTLEDGARFKGSIDMTPKADAEVNPQQAVGVESGSALPMISQREKTAEKG